MKLELSESQNMLRDMVTKLFAEKSSPNQVRVAEKAAGFDQKLWEELVALGLPQVRATDPADGGSSLLDAALIAEQAGRYLVSAPLIEAIVANALLHRAGAHASVLAELEQGAIATLVLQPLSVGRRQIVQGGAVAKYVIALDGDELVLLVREPGGTASRTMAACAIDFVDLGADVQAIRHVLAVGEDARAAFIRSVEEWKILSAAYLVGLARQALEMAAVYARERVQFSRPIGAFQAVAHPLADSVTDVEGAQWLVWWAIWANATGRDDASASNSMAWWWAGQAARPAVLRSLHTFGGYGVSMEYDIQLYYRRALQLSMLLGDAENELDRIAERLFDGDIAALPPAGDVEIDFSYGEAADAYAAELRAFVMANMTPEIEAKKHHSTSGHHQGFHKKLAQAGYAFPHFSVDDGPKRSRYEMMASASLWDELDWTCVPTATSDMLARVAEVWSQPEAKEEIISRFISGDSTGALGFSEPGSGSDIFAAKFNAVRDGDDWLMNGQKMFTTNAQNADYILMMTRTNNTGRKHEGITMFIMPLKLPGVEIHPVYTLQDERTNIVFFDNVRVPDKYRLGEVDKGMAVMGLVLELEHGGASYHYAQMSMMNHAMSWAGRANGNGIVPLGEQRVRRVLARAQVNNAVSEALVRRSTWGDVEGLHEIALGPMTKLFTTEALYRDGLAITELAAPASLVWNHDRDLSFVELNMRRAIAMQIYGGTSEIHRSLIAEQVLGLPKSRS